MMDESRDDSPFEKTIRIYGNPPCHVAVVHGGPGAAGEMAAVAVELSDKCGVIEPLQSADSVAGQIRELSEIIRFYGKHPITLTGFSWGAWLCFLLTAKYPDLVRKLILIGSGPFEERFAGNIHSTRIQRLSPQKRKQAEEFMVMLHSTSSTDLNDAFCRFGALLTEADTFDADESRTPEMFCDFHIFQKVWPEASRLRQSGQLLDFGKQIRCPVVAIHGDWDPHPAEGVLEPLSRVLKDFRFILLKKCGHRPWIEKQAKEEFFRILRQEIQ